MSRTALLGLAVLACAILLAVSASLWSAERRRAQLAARLALVSTSLGAVPDRPPRSASPATRVAAAFGRMLADSGLLPAATLTELRQSLGNTALSGPNGLAIFIGAKAILALCLVPIGVAVAQAFGVGGMFRFVLPAASGIAGLLAPDYALRSMRRRYVRAAGAGLADALDMLVICAEAGLGLEPGIERVAQELAPAHPQTAREFELTAGEFRLVADRRQVLLNFSRRTGLASLQRLATALIQASQFGTPLSQALRTLAAELRRETLTAYEARAARLPVMLTLPMILFILPCVFIIAAGPAVLQVAHTFGNK